MPWKIFIVSILLAFGFVGNASAQTESDIRTYIARYKELAKSEQIRTGVPAAIKLAQGIHESTAGTSDLASRSNNHFGIKCKSTWRGDTVLHDDDARQECFRKYPDVAKSYMDHSDFLRGSQRYAPLFALEVNDYIGWASGLKKAGYATNPAYVRKITDLIERFELQQYTLEAQKKTRVDTTNAGSGNAGISETTVNNAPQEVVPVLYKGLKGFWASKGQSLVDKSVLYGVKYSKLLLLNDLPDAPLSSNMFIFIEPKRIIGQSEFHMVREGESMQVISQKEAIRLDSLMAYNNLLPGQEVMPGEKVVLLPGKISFPRTRDNQVAGNTHVSKIVSSTSTQNSDPKTGAASNPVIVNNESGMPTHLSLNKNKEIPDSATRLTTRNNPLVNTDTKPSVDSPKNTNGNGSQVRVVRDTVIKVQRGNLPQSVIVRKEASVPKGGSPVNLTPGKNLPKKDTLLVSAEKIDTPQVVVNIPQPTSSDVLDVEKARRTEALLISSPLFPEKSKTASSSNSNVVKTGQTGSVPANRNSNDPTLSAPVKDLKQKLDQIVYEPNAPKKGDSVKSPVYGANDKKDMVKANPVTEMPSHLKPEPPKPVTPPVRMRPAEVIVPTTNYDEPHVSDSVKNLRRKFDVIVNTPLPERPYKDPPVVVLPKPVTETAVVANPTKPDSNKPATGKSKNALTSQVKTNSPKGGKAPAKSSSANKGKSGAKPKAPVKKKK